MENIDTSAHAAKFRAIADHAEKDGVKKRPAVLRGIADLIDGGRYAAALAEAEDAPKRDGAPEVTKATLAAADGLREALGMPPRVAPAAAAAPPAPRAVGSVLFTVRAPHHHLLAAVGLCADITPAKPTRAALACVQIECRGESIGLRASGEHDTIERTIPAECSGAGTAMLDARGLLRRVSALDAGDVELRISAADVAIYQDGKRRYTVSVFDAGDAPKPIGVDPQGADVDAKGFAALLARAQPFAATEDDKPAAQKSVRLQAIDGKIRAMALTSAAGSLGVMPFDGTIDALVMGSEVTQIRKVLAKSGAKAKIATVGPSIYVFGDGFAYSTRTIGDAFPPLEKILPPRSGPMFTARRADMIKAVEAIRVTDPHLGRLRFRPSKDNVTLLGVDANGQTADAYFAADSTIMSISIGIEHVAKAIEFVTEETIEVWIDPGDRSVDGGAGAALFCGKNSPESVLVMPIKYDAKDLEA